MKAQIAYLGSDDRFRKLLSNVLESNGYAMATFLTPAALASAIPTPDTSFIAALIDTTGMKTLPVELMPVVSRVPTVLIKPRSGDELPSEGVIGPVVLGRPLSIPRLLKTLYRFGSSSGEDGQPETKTALVVDDDPSFRMFVEEILKSAGYTVHTAEDGIAALETLDKVGIVSTFVVDLEMPRMDGPTLIEKLCDRLQNPSILIMTGTQNIDLLRWGRSAGLAYGLIEKPFSSRTFLRYFGEAKQ